jgi:phospholipase C
VHIGENETFYDEAVPPYEDVPADESSCTQRPGCSSGTFDFRRLGLRTTGLLISPWIPSGTVIQRPRQGRYNSSQFELTSILSTTRELFGSEENYLLGPLTQRDAWSASFAELLTLDEPRVDAPVRLPG